MSRLINSVQKNAFFWWTLVCTVALFFVYNEKSYGITPVIYGVGLFVGLRLSVIDTLFAMLLFVLPFQRGIRGWTIPVVPHGTQMWEPGYSFYFGFSLKLIFFAALFCIYLCKPINEKLSTVQQKFSYGMIAFAALALIGSFSTITTTVTALGAIQFLFPIGVFLLSQPLLRSPEQKNRFILLVVVQLLFLGIIGTWQLASHHALGLFLEDNAFIDPVGFITTEGAPAYRVSGLTGHPTFFGSYLVLLLAPTLGYLIEKWKARISLSTETLPALLAWIFGIIALIGTLTRSAWGGCVMIAAIYYWRIHKTTRVARGLRILFLTTASGIVLFLGIMVATRLATLRDIPLIDPMVGRLGLIREAGIMIERFPLFGVGINQFTAVMAHGPLTVQLRAFLYPVHNTFLLFFAELGVPAGLLFGIVVTGILITSWKYVRAHFIALGVWLGVLTFVMNAQFQPLFSQDPTLDMAMIFLAYLSTLL